SAFELVSDVRRRLHRAGLAVLGPRRMVRARSRATRLRGLAVVSVDRFQSGPRKSRYCAAAPAGQRHRSASLLRADRERQFTALGQAINVRGRLPWLNESLL